MFKSNLSLNFERERTMYFLSKSLKGILSSVTISSLLLFSGCVSSGGTTTDPTSPILTSANTKNVNENQTSAITLSATDNNTITYSISGTDSAKFNINSSSGVVTFKTAPDYENPTDDNSDNNYVFVANASNGTDNTIQTVTITVDDVNEAPSINTTFTNISIDDNTTRKIDINISDVDGDSLILSIDTNDTNFTISPNFTNPIVQADYSNQTLDFNITSDYGISKIVKITINVSDTELNSTTSFNILKIFTWKGKVYNTVTSPYTSKVWLDRNLGASQVCTAFDDSNCYGEYFQWGRNYDGHQESNNTTTSTRATNINATVANGKFITNGLSPYDWLENNTQDANNIDDNGSIRSANWSKIDGTSVCPVGFRVPTEAELQEETTSQGVNNSADAYANFLKLPSAGYRSGGDGSLGDQGFFGDVWSSSSVVESNSRSLDFGSSSADWSSGDRADGISVRCVRD